MTASTCVAVGGAQAGGLAEAWNGSAWSVQTVPAPPGAIIASLTAVSCNPSACTAVGDYQAKTGQLLVYGEQWNGSAWSYEAVPLSNRPAAAELDGVSCTAPADCTAVGANGGALVEKWNGTAWAIQATPGLAASGFNDVSCPAAATCAAVGTTAVASGGGVASLAAVSNGTTWTPVRSPSPQGAVFDSLLGGVSCPSPTECVAVGNAFGVSTAVNLATFAEIWNGTTWTVLPIPNRTGSSRDSLVAVSCASPSACVAVGSYRVGISERDHPLAEVWNGHTWRVQTVPVLPDASSASLNAVSCTAPSACTAAGVTANGAGPGLVERWNGSTWSPETTPALGSGNTILTGVSCASATACTAVGSHNAVPLAEVWNGSVWTAQKVPLPKNSQFGEFLAVSCTAPAACTATGDRSTPHREFSLAERWNGSSWLVQPTPNPQGGDDVQLMGVSCTAPANCSAVGDWTSIPLFRHLTVAEHWNGTSWAIQPTANPGPSFATDGSTRLAAVSCHTPASCTAVGSYTVPAVFANVNLTLAEAPGH